MNLSLNLRKLIEKKQLKVQVISGKFVVLKDGKQLEKAALVDLVNEAHKGE